MPKIVDPEARREEIAEAAARLIARHGVEAATMRQVAAEAGCTTGAVTHYFTDKNELLHVTFQHSLAQRRALRPPRRTTAPAGQLRAALEGALPLDESRRRHWLVTLACCVQAAGDPALAAVQREAYREFRDHVATLAIEAGLTGQDARDGSREDAREDARSVAEALIAAADGIAVQALMDPPSWPASRQREALAAAMSRSMTTLIGAPTDR